MNESTNSRAINSSNDVYDIFLSHSTNDAQKVAGLKLLMEDMGFKVYVDWIEDPQLNRKQVNKNTALILRERMKQSAALVYAFSENSGESRWMPWELGYFDGIKGMVAVLPISTNSSSSFQGTEYLGMYPYINIDEMVNTTTEFLWLHETRDKYIRFDFWLKYKLMPTTH